MYHLTGVLTILFFLLPLSLTAQTATHRAPLDFDGDGRTDIAVARIALTDIHQRGPLLWWVLGSQSNQPMPLVQFGLFNNLRDLPIPADYDGDGKTDIAVFRRNFQGPNGDPGSFIINRSSDHSAQWIQWGLDSDDVYLTQDFDGDGKADPTVVRCFIPTMPIQILPEQTWYILESSTNYQSYRVEKYGKCAANLDRPIRGDFDGDGKADLAFYRKFDIDAKGETRPANRFYMKLSGRRNTERRVTFDFVSDGRVLEGDFDGDGKTDIASATLEQVGEINYVRWNWIRSSDGQIVAKQFGSNNPDFDQRDLPVPGDYDGDGITDLAIYRTTSLGNRQGYFHIEGSKEGYKVIPWGLYLPDLPVSNYIYVR